MKEQDKMKLSLNCIKSFDPNGNVPHVLAELLQTEYNRLVDKQVNESISTNNDTFLILYHMVIKDSSII